VNGHGSSEVEGRDQESEEEFVIRVVRPPGTGFGISIAGGVGATPFRGDDEVATFSCSTGVSSYKLRSCLCWENRDLWFAHCPLVLLA